MEQAKLGNVRFTVLSSENITQSADVTDNPVENGQDVSDHVKQQPTQLSLSGLIVGENDRNRYERLIGFKEKGQRINYFGRETHKSMVITNLNRNYGKSNKTGFAFNIDLKQVRVGTAKNIVIKKSAPKSAVKEVAPSKIAIQSRGRTFMRQGDRGNDVKALQSELNKLGYGLSADGIYGPKTRAAVVRFQKKYKLGVDGLAGKQVIGKLSSLASSSISGKKVSSKTGDANNKGKQQTKKR